MACARRAMWWSPPMAIKIRSTSPRPPPPPAARARRTPLVPPAPQEGGAAHRSPRSGPRAPVGCPPSANSKADRSAAFSPRWARSSASRSSKPSTSKNAKAASSVESSSILVTSRRATSISPSPLSETTSWSASTTRKSRPEAHRRGPAPNRDHQQSPPYRIQQGDQEAHRRDGQPREFPRPRRSPRPARI